MKIILLCIRLLAVSLGIILMVVAATRADSSRAKMSVAIVYDIDVSKFYGRSEVDRAIETIGRQVALDVTVYNETVSAIAAHTNPPALVNSTVMYAANQTYSSQVNITIFLTKRVLGIGSQRFRGFTYQGSAANGGALVVQLIGDGYDYQTIAHEIAHMLNAPHDDDGACKGAPNSFGFIMQAYVSGSEVFSECSLREINAFMTGRPSLFYPAPPAPPPPVQKYGEVGSFDEILIGFLSGIAFFAYVQRRR